MDGMSIPIIHYSDVIMDAMASQFTSLVIVHMIVYSGADQRKHQTSAPLAFVWGSHRWPVNFPHKWPVTWKTFPFDDVFISSVVEVSTLNKPDNSWWETYRILDWNRSLTTPSGRSEQGRSYLESEYLKELMIDDILAGILLTFGVIILHKTSAISKC